MRDAERLADRLRVMGPRLAARDGDAAAAALDRIRAVLHDLAAAGADLRGDPADCRRREVPSLAPHALADQLLVLAHEVFTDTTPDPKESHVRIRRDAHRLMNELRSRL
jgi:hypothetical protein